MATKQCGTCEFWDERSTYTGAGECGAPMAESVKAWDRNMYSYDGQNCAVYTKIKEDL